MVTTTRWILAFSLSVCAVVGGAPTTSITDSGPIPLSELVDELRRENLLLRLSHLLYMLQVASSGDQVYQLSKNLSAECAVTLRAIGLMLEKLTLCASASSLALSQLVVVAQELGDAQYPNEHPLEAVCAKVNKKFVEDAYLSGAFAKAKQEAAQSKASARPPYLGAILNASVADTLCFKLVDQLSIPQFARLMAAASFSTVLLTKNAQSTSFFSPRRHSFAKACVAVAKEAQYADVVQRVFAQALNDTTAQIVAGDKQKGRMACADNLGVWWVPQMMKTIYSYVSSNPDLKKEIERMAPIANEDAGAEDLDFSKL